MANGCQSLLSLAESRHLAAYLCPITTDECGRWAVGLGSALCGWQCHPGTSTCSRCKKSTAEAEALGRSQGGFSTKLHLRAERSEERRVAKESRCVEAG